MIQHLLQKHKQEYIVDIRSGQKVFILMLYFDSFQFELNMLLFPFRTYACGMWSKMRRKVWAKTTICYADKREIEGGMG